MSANFINSNAAGRRIVRNEELLRLMLMGLTLPECAAQMKMNLHTIRLHARKPEFLILLKEHSSEIAKRLVEELSTSQIEMAQRLEEASSAALEEMMRMMGELDSPSQLKLKVCQDLLDRDPKSSRTKRVDLTGSMSHEFINPAVLIHAAATAKEMQEFQSRKGQLPNGDGSPIDNDNRGNGQG